MQVGGGEGVEPGFEGQDLKGVQPTVKRAPASGMNTCGQERARCSPEEEQTASELVHSGWPKPPSSSSASVVKTLAFSIGLTASRE